jgi:hypothetical protein
MKNTLSKVVTSILFLTLVGCAPVKFYSNSELTQKSGLKYYTVKPYLLVERDPATGNILKATVVYMPDLENPQYMVVRDGLGSRKVDLKLTEGSINTISVATDPKIAESLEALATLAAKGTAALADLSALKGVYPTAVSSSVTELYEVFMVNGVTTVKKIDIK